MSAREELAAAYDPAAFDPERKTSKHPAAQIQWAARRKLAVDAADRLLASEFLAKHDAEVRGAEREAVAVAIETVASSDDYVWASARQSLNHAAHIARAGTAEVGA